MAYSTVEEVRATLSGQRGKPEDIDANSLDDDQIEYAISGADAQINGALRGKYIIPLQSMGSPIVSGDAYDLIHTISVDIAVYNCYLIYRVDREFASTLASVLLRYQRALTMLIELQAGDMELGVDELGYGSVDGGAPWVFNQYDGPMFPSTNIFNAPEGYIPPDYLYR
jgi:phage gp36-like protein